MEHIAPILLAGLSVGLAKGGLGALGAIITPLVILAMPDSEKQAVGMVLILLIVGDWLALYVYWRRWEGWRMRLLMLGAIAGIAGGSLLLGALPNDAVRKIVGVIGIFMAVYTVVQGRLTGVAYQPRNWHAVFSGGVSGFTSSLANAGGPPFNAYMLLQNVEPRTFVATSTLFFAVVNAIKVPFFLFNGALQLDLLPLVLPGMLLVPVGVWLGKKVVDYINRGVFAAIVWIGLVISSMLLLTQ